MKNKVLTALFSIGTLFAGAQSDSSYTKKDSILVKSDTIKVGNFFIVKKGGENVNGSLKGNVERSIGPFKT